MHIASPVQCRNSPADVCACVLSFCRGCVLDRRTANFLPLISPCFTSCGSDLELFIADRFTVFPQKMPSLLSPSFSVGHNTSESCGRIYQSSGSFAQIERGGGRRSCPCPRSPFPGPGVSLRSWVNRLRDSSQIYRAYRSFSKPAPLCG